jgi:hypothetical protein
LGRSTARLPRQDHRSPTPAKKLRGFGWNDSLVAPAAPVAWGYLQRRRAEIRRRQSMAKQNLFLWLEKLIFIIYCVDKLIWSPW